MAVYWIATFFEITFNGWLLSYYASCVMVNHFRTWRLNRDWCRRKMWSWFRPTSQHITWGPLMTYNERPVGQAVGRSPILCAEQTSFPWMYYRHANLTKHIISWTRSLDTSWNAAACEWGCNSIVTTTTTATNNNNSPACEASQELAF